MQLIHEGAEAMIKSIFHININVTNFDRSLEFYKTSVSR